MDKKNPVPMKTNTRKTPRPHSAATSRAPRFSGRRDGFSGLMTVPPFYLGCNGLRAGGGGNGKEPGAPAMIGSAGPSRLANNARFGARLSVGRTRLGDGLQRVAGDFLVGL